MKFLKLAGLLVLSFIGGTFLCSVYDEISIFGFLTVTPEGEPIGIFNGPYPVWFHFATWSSVAVIVWTLVFIYRISVSWWNGLRKMPNV